MALRKSSAASITAATSGSGSTTRSLPLRSTASSPFQRRKIRRERHVTVAREALRQVERVLYEAVALVQDDDSARRRSFRGK